MKKKSLALLVLMLLMSGMARAATYYVDYDRGSDAAPGTRNAPWKRCPGMPGFAGRYTHAAFSVTPFTGADGVGASHTTSTTTTYTSGATAATSFADVAMAGLTTSTTTPVFSAGAGWSGSTTCGATLASTVSCGVTLRLVQNGSLSGNVVFNTNASTSPDLVSMIAPGFVSSISGQAKIYGSASVK